MGVTVSLRALRLLAGTALCACGPGCSRPEPAAEPIALDTAETTVQLVDSAIPPAIAGEAGWNYQQSATADLTGDGEPERIVLTARVEMFQGRPAWDDGQPWQVYLESGPADRTYLYSQRLQLGTLTMRIAEPGSGSLPSIILLEHLPDRLRLIEAYYPEAGGEPATVVRFERALDPRGEIASPQLP